MKPENVQILDDGFGNQWEKCGKDCELEIVRPGKVQCEKENCPLYQRTMRIPEPAGYWVIPEENRKQPVADVPTWLERFEKRTLYGWTWEPYQPNDKRS